MYDYLTDEITSVSMMINGNNNGDQISIQPRKRKIADEMSSNGSSKKKRKIELRLKLATIAESIQGKTFERDEIWFLCTINQTNLIFLQKFRLIQNRMKLQSSGNQAMETPMINRLKKNVILLQLTLRSHLVAFDASNYLHKNVIYLRI